MNRAATAHTISRARALALAAAALLAPCLVAASVPGADAPPVQVFPGDSGTIILTIAFIAALVALLCFPARSAVIAPIHRGKTFLVLPCIECDNERLMGKRGVRGQSLSMPRGSPALIGEPSFSSGNSSMTIWGLGWFSGNDQFVELKLPGYVIWTDGQGNKTNYIASFSSAVPTFSSVLVDTDTRMTAVSFTSMSLTSVQVRTKYGTSRIFSVAESTGVLRLAQLIDRNGNTVTYSRDNVGRITKAMDVHGRSMSMTYNAAGLVATLSDSSGRTMSYSYDAAGHRVSDTGPLGTMSYVYDSQNRMTKITYPNGGVKNYAYDSQNRVISEDDGNGNDLKTYVYGSTFTSVTDALGHTTVSEFISLLGLHRISKITDPAGSVTNFTYDPNTMKLLSSTDPLGRPTNFKYDANGNVAQAQDATGASAQASYEGTFNQPLSMSDAMGHAAAMSYDGSGNLTQVTDPLGYSTQRLYDGQGHLTQSQDALGNQTSFSYNMTNGALASVTDPLNRTSAFTTDALSRVTQNTDPAGHSAKYAYDTAGDVTEMTDAAGNITSYIYTPGRRRNVLSSLKDALSHTTSFTYDDLERQIAVVNADNQTKTSAYDAKGNVTKTVNARNQTATYAYDNLDRLTARTSPEGTISFTYDAVGNQLTASHYNGSGLGTTYDALNRPSQVTTTLPNGFKVTIGYTYDAKGNRTQMTTPWGNFSYSYDANNRLTSITNPQNQTLTFTYDAVGRRQTLSYPNGITASYAYDAAGQLLSITHANTASQVVIASAAYSYDRAGNRTGMTDGEGVHSYSYDNLNRLRAAIHPLGTSLPIQNETFSYDAVGNRTADALRTSYTYDAANRLQSDSAFTYTADADGNLTNKTDRASGAKTALVYDSANALIEVDGSTFAVAIYKYDVNGVRIEKNVGGQVTRYVYENGRLLATTDGNNNLMQLFTDGPGMDMPLVAQSNGSSYFFHAAALGNIEALTDSNGSVIETYEYQAYGRPTIKAANGNVLAQSIAGNNLRFASREFDTETGLNYMRARYLDFDTARFTGEDPVGRVNRYAYVSGNPNSLTDPSGLSYADAGKILDVFDQQVAQMNATHSRLPLGQTTSEPTVTGFFLGWANNRLGYLECRSQANTLQTALQEKGIPRVNPDGTVFSPANYPHTAKWDAKWSSQDFYPYPSPLQMQHVQTLVTSSDPDDPDIILDTWSNYFQLYRHGTILGPQDSSDSSGDAVDIWIGGDLIDNWNPDGSGQ